MFRFLLVIVGLLVLGGGYAAWHYGFLTRKVDEVTTEMDRRTAVARSEKTIRDSEAFIARFIGFRGDQR